MGFVANSLTPLLGFLAIGLAPLLGFRAIAPAPLLDPLAIALALLVGLLTCQRAVPIRLVSLTSSLYLGRLVIEEALALGVLALLLPQCLVVESAGGVCAHGEQGSHVLPLPAQECRERQGTAQRLRRCLIGCVGRSAALRREAARRAGR